jgi:hypothetical protein
MLSAVQSAETWVFEFTFTKVAYSDSWQVEVTRHPDLIDAAEGVVTGWAAWGSGPPSANEPRVGSIIVAVKPHPDGDENAAMREARNVADAEFRRHHPSAA